VDIELSKVVVAPESDIRTAWRALDASGLRVVLIASENNKFFGIATDGDIRRGLLSQSSLGDPISTVANTSPFTVGRACSKKELIALMKQEGILALPVVEDGRLLGIETLQSLLVAPKIDNPVFIMAGGFGTRLRPLTDNCPKPMLKVGSKPILEIGIEQFKKLGFHNFYISTHYMPEVIMNYFGDGSDRNVSITYVHEEKPLGTGGALGLLSDLKLASLPVIVMNGDILTKADFRHLVEFHEKNSADATMCVREYEYKIPYGVVNGSKGKVVSMEEKPTKRFSVNAGVYVISPEIISGVSKNERIDLPTLLQKKIYDNKTIQMYPIHDYWLDIGRMDDFNQAQADIYSLDML